MTASESRQRHLWSYSRSIGNLISIRRKAVSAFRDLLVAWNVTRANNHREDKLVCTFFVFQCLNVANCYLDLIAWQNVRDRLREDVRPFLIKQTCRLST